MLGANGVRAGLRRNRCEGEVKCAGRRCLNGKHPVNTAHGHVHRNRHIPRRRVIHQKVRLARERHGRTSPGQGQRRRDGGFIVDDTHVDRCGHSHVVRFVGLCHAAPVVRRHNHVILTGAYLRNDEFGAYVIRASWRGVAVSRDASDQRVAARLVVERKKDTVLPRCVRGAVARVCHAPAQHGRLSRISLVRRLHLHNNQVRGLRLLEHRHRRIAPQFVTRCPVDDHAAERVIARLARGHGDTVGERYGKRGHCQPKELQRTRRSGARIDIRAGAGHDGVKRPPVRQRLFQGQGGDGIRARVA